MHYNLYIYSDWLKGVSGSRKKKEKVIPLIMALVGGLSIILGLILFIWRELMKNSVPKGEGKKYQAYSKKNNKKGCYDL